MTTYYVATSGSDAAAGTEGAPFATLQKAHNVANPGDTIYLRGGTYTLAAQVAISRNGSSGNLIKVFNYTGEVPVLDGIALTNQNDSCIRLNSASWWHFKGLELKNGPSMGFWVTGASTNNIIERCVTHHNVRLRSSGGGNGILVDGTSANNLILNNDSHHNGNPAVSVSAGDGIGVNYTKATGNIVRGNRMWRNNDDGLDLWDAANVLVENNWSWENGYTDALTPSGGNGSGFKLGGGGTGDGAHTVRNNLAWENWWTGFDDNGANVPMSVYNNTAYQNAGGGGNNFGFYMAVANVLKNNLAYPNTASFHAAVLQSFNSWNLGVTVSAADFASLDFSGADDARAADGSLPTLAFLKLVAGSDLIDKGVNVGIAYTGAAPDLGAYEDVAAASDTTAPTVPASLTATAVSGSQINLSWAASTDAVGVTGYKVYRGGVQIGVATGTTHQDTGLAAATEYTYTVAAYDAAGNTSAQSTGASETTQGDTTAPTVSIASPTGGIVAGTVTVSVAAADNVGVTQVVLLVNGLVVATDNAAPWQFSWNTSAVPNGATQLTARAFDAAGNSAQSAIVTVNVANAVAPPPDTTPPVISSVGVNANKVTATITWTTNELSDSVVAYGTNANSLTLTSSSPTMVIAHSVLLNGLTKNTKYYYRISSRDAAGNQSSTAVYSFIARGG